MNTPNGKLKFTLIKAKTQSNIVPGQVLPKHWNFEDQAFANVTLTTLAMGTYILAVAIFG